MSRRVLSLILGTLLGLALAGPVDAQSTVTGPTVALDRYEVAPGDQIVLTIDGFDAPGVTISVCGNEARRGSADCNMPESEGRGLRRDGTPTYGSLPVSAPPVPCPCVIRVSTATNDQVAVVPITIIGHPVAPVVDPDIPQRVPLDVSIVANESTAGVGDVLRSSLGGASSYELTVTVRNRSTTAVDALSLSGFAGRNADDELITLELPDPGPIAAGQTWQETIAAELPALTLGDIEWQVTASGAGSSVQAKDTTSDLPILLMVLGVILLLDLLVLFTRLLTRRRRTRGQHADDDPLMDDPDRGDFDGEAAACAAREGKRAPELVR